MTRQEVIRVLGQPEHTGSTSRKYRTPSVFKYGELELHFGQGPGGLLFLAYKEDEGGNGVVLLE
jgi:hypothetical protein